MTILQEPDLLKKGFFSLPGCTRLGDTLSLLHLEGGACTLMES